MMKILKEQQERIEKFKSENLVNSYLGTEVIQYIKVAYQMI